MTFALGAVDLSWALVRLPKRGVWSARLGLAENRPPARDARTLLTLGTLQLACTVIEPGMFVEAASVFVVGGAGGWRRAVRARRYRADNGIRLSTTARDLAADAKELLEVDPALDRVLGYAWMRPEGLASAALDELAAVWWVAPDGVTRLGPRPTVQAPDHLAIDPYEPDIGRAVIGVPDDDLARLIPGAVIPELDGFVVGSAIVRLTDRRIDVEVWR